MHCTEQARDAVCCALWYQHWFCRHVACTPSTCVVHTRTKFRVTLVPRFYVWPWRRPSGKKMGQNGTGFRFAPCGFNRVTLLSAVNIDLLLIVSSAVSSAAVTNPYDTVRISQAAATANSSLAATPMTHHGSAQFSINCQQDIIVQKLVTNVASRTAWWFLTVLGVVRHCTISSLWIIEDAWGSHTVALAYVLAYSSIGLTKPPKPRLSLRWRSLCLVLGSMHGCFWTRARPWLRLWLCLLVLFFYVCSRLEYYGSVRLRLVRILLSFRTRARLWPCTWIDIWFC